MPRLLTSSEFTDTENRVVRAVAVIYGLAHVAYGSFNYMAAPMLSDLDATPSQSSLLRALPSMAGLLVIFPVGVLGGRIGLRRVLAAAGWCMTAGGVALAAAPVVWVAMAGVAFSGAARFALYVAAVAALTVSTAREGVRPVALGIVFATVAVALLVVPLLAGSLDAVGSWRWIAGLWALSGVGVLLAVRLLLPHGAEQPTQQGEFVSPVLAGVLLLCVVQAVHALGRDLAPTTAVVAWAVGAVVASAMLVVASRLLPSPTISLGSLRRDGLASLLLVVVLLPFSNLLYYTTIGLQYFYGRSVLAVAVLLVPAQLAGSLASREAGPLVKAKGSAVTGTVLMVALAGVSFLSAAQTATVSIVVPVAVVTVYWALFSAAIVPVQTAVMDRAGPGEESSVSAWRLTSLSLGMSLGVISMALVVTAAMMSVYDDAGAGDLDADQAAELTLALREGTTENQAAAQYGLPEDEVVSLSDAQQDALLAGFRAQGIAGGVVVLVAAGVFYATSRRHPDAPPAAA